MKKTLQKWGRGLAIIWSVLATVSCVAPQIIQVRAPSPPTRLPKPPPSRISEAPKGLAAPISAPSPYALTPVDREKLASLATAAIGKSKLTVNKKTFRADCSGTVRGIFAAAKLKLGGIVKPGEENDTKAIYRFVRKYGQILQNSPEPGDLVFFHNTYDRSRNGRMNDALTHVGIVEKVEEDTVLFVHYLGRSIIRSRMNLTYKKNAFHPETGVRINHVLRRAQGHHRSYTAGELFAGYGRL
jgi:hypothetical protein